jgi:hypothetical protein
VGPDALHETAVLPRSRAIADEREAAAPEGQGTRVVGRERAGYGSAREDGGRAAACEAAEEAEEVRRGGAELGCGPLSHFEIGGAGVGGGLNSHSHGEL